MIDDQMTKEDGRGCIIIGRPTIEELDAATRDRDIVAGPYWRDPFGFGQHYVYVRMTNADRRYYASRAAESIKNWQDRGLAVGANYVAECAAECEALGIPVAFAA
jgi:hypothetical protein